MLDETEAMFVCLEALGRVDTGENLGVFEKDSRVKRIKSLALPGSGSESGGYFATFFPRDRSFSSVLVYLL